MHNEMEFSMQLAALHQLQLPKKMRLKSSTLCIAVTVDKEFLNSPAPDIPHGAISTLDRSGLLRQVAPRLASWLRSSCFDLDRCLSYKHTAVSSMFCGRVSETSDSPAIENVSPSRCCNASRTTPPLRIDTARVLLLSTGAVDAPYRFRHSARVHRCF